MEWANRLSRRKPVCGLLKNPDNWRVCFLALCTPCSCRLHAHARYTKPLAEGGEESGATRALGGWMLHGGTGIHLSPRVPVPPAGSLHFTMNQGWNRRVHAPGPLLGRPTMYRQLHGLREFPSAPLSITLPILTGRGWRAVITRSIYVHYLHCMLLVDAG